MVTIFHCKGVCGHKWTLTEQQAKEVGQCGPMCPQCFMPGYLDKIQAKRK